MRTLLAFLVLWLATAPAAAAVSEADRAAVQSTIEQQLQAFQRDDGATAYSFAAPNIKQRFPSAGSFMQMVQTAYPQVYRPRSHAFAELEEKGAELQQSVDIIDGAGVAWTAVYTLQKQPDGSWKITGCYLVKSPSVA